MKKVISVFALLFAMSMSVNAQGFLKKLKQKAQQAVGGIVGMDKQEDSEDATATLYDNDPPSYNDEGNDNGGLIVAQGSDIVPKRKTVTVTWDGTVTPSKASSASALMAELPPLPSAEKMARSSMEERDAYALKIAAVVLRAEQLQAAERECSDAEMEAERKKWENKLQNLFGLTKEEMAILQDENAPESKRQPIQDKVMKKIMGVEGFDQAEMARFEKMSEKEQEAYIKAHPEFMQKMQKIAMNAGNFSKQAKQMTAGVDAYVTKLGKLNMDYVKFMEREDQHDYSTIAARYNARLQNLYDDICDTEDAGKVDALYKEADAMLYNYRLDAAKEYRASLQRQIAEAKKFAAEYGRLTKEVVESGDLPACAIGRTDLNAVIAVANLLDDAYKELPEPGAQPVCREVLYTLPKGWNFGVWECRGFMGSVEGFKVGGSWPLLCDNCSGERTEYAVVENGKFRKIGESELERINKQADQRLKSASKNNPPYGTYKSHSGLRVVEYSKTGELIVNGMTTFHPVAFTAKTGVLEWIILDGEEIVKCTYKL
ncbi:MAG: hypothetical protein IJ580_00875 [Prevotella sp.]|nr:hypothetical protein [Prevotella sp.]MBR1556828.1 hypothetical protein [Prevotella sp.]